MKVLVTGAGGFLGRSVVDELCNRAHSVRAIIRPTSPEPSWSRKVEVFRADLAAANENLQRAFDGVDAVVHLAAATSGPEAAQLAATVGGTERMLEAMALSPVKRLLHVSSLVVYDWGQAQGILNEETALLEESHLASMGAYTLAKTRQEGLVSRFSQNYGWDLTIMRPGYIWGPNHAAIAGMGRCIGPLYLMFGPLSRLPLTHVDNCAHCLVSALENPAATGQTFNIVDGDDVRVWRYAWEYARGTGRPGLPVPMPYRISHAAVRLASFASRILRGGDRQLPSLLTPRRFESQFKPLRFGNRKLKAVLGWTPPLSFEECVRRTYAPAQEPLPKRSMSLDAAPK